MRHWIFAENTVRKHTHSDLYIYIYACIMYLYICITESYETFILVSAGTVKFSDVNG